MPEETFETPQPTQPVTKPKTTNWPKIILAAVLGLALLTAAAYAGYWYGTESSNLKSQSAKTQLKTQNQITPRPEADRPLDETPEPTTPLVTDPTANWKTYRSGGYAFEIRYPENWRVSQEEKDKPAFKFLLQLSQTSPETLSNFVVVVKQESYEEVYRELKEISERYNGNINPFRLNDKIADAQRAIFYTGSHKSDYVIHTIFERGSNAFDVVASFVNPPKERELSEFDQILSTFKFLE